MDFVLQQNGLTGNFLYTLKLFEVVPAVIVMTVEDAYYLATRMKMDKIELIQGTFMRCLR